MRKIHNFGKTQKYTVKKYNIIHYYIHVFILLLTELNFDLKGLPFFHKADNHYVCCSATYLILVKLVSASQGRSLFAVSFET